MKKKSFNLNSQQITVFDVYQVSKNLDTEIKLGNKAKNNLKNARLFLQKALKKGEPIYGINTGFGALADKRISSENLSELQYNLIRSHCTGVGDYFPVKTVRAIMFIRAHCLSFGNSGITPYAVELLLKMLNENIIPCVPEKGSVGASGDLAPLAHIALTLIGEGKVFYKQTIQSTSTVFKKLNITPLILGAKDGLSLINGTSVMSALGSIAIADAIGLSKLCDLAGALTLDSIKGTDSAYDLDISLLKPHPGQIAVSKNLKKILNGSKILNSHKSCQKVQDPYSLRCIPQVHGACRQTIAHAKEVLEVEINSVNDNPLLFPSKNKIISGGNFHGEAVALAMDYLAMGLAEFCNISERRIEKMMNPLFSELPPFLTKGSGLCSGLMITQVTAAALASENKYLCHPASIDSIPTSTDKEDHVSMGLTSGLKLQKVLDNLKYILAIEFLCSTAALDFNNPKKTSNVLYSIYKTIRKRVPKITNDRVFHNDITEIYKLICNDTILQVMQDSIGDLI